MCGISCVLFAEQEEARAFHSRHVEKLLTNRGPDYSSIVYRDGILYHATVLWQQGSEVCVQPVESDDVVLMFNGDLYMDVGDGSESDTEFLFGLIKAAGSEEELVKVLADLTGPYSIICFFQSRLYFARDPLGRNSLILGKFNDSIFLSSVIDPTSNIEAIELPPVGIFRIDPGTKQLELFPFHPLDAQQHNLQQLELLNKILPVEVHQPILPAHQKPLEAIPSYSFDVCTNIEDNENLFENLLKLPAVSATCDTFLRLLSSSVHDRTKRTQKFCKTCITSSDPSCSHSNIGILFSGGVDCSLIAVLADKFIEPHRTIDLMNVAFEKVSYSGKKDESINWNVPDRLTGLDTLNELRALRPHRQWRFVEINVTRAELNGHLRKLSSLVFPLSNVLDESLGTAFHFASRGVGTVHGQPYSSPCRVILSGSGADELFGGYSRHRNAFKRSTPDRDLLAEELNLDWVRLPTRNLARDDRVIGDHGITVRAPFIEENFVNFALQLKPLQRCFPALAEGVGDKLLLRLCAHKLNLKVSSKLRKRAFQFGSRIADKRQSAKDKSKLLTESFE